MHQYSLNIFLFFRVSGDKRFPALIEQHGIGVSLASLPSFPGIHAKRGVPFSAALTLEGNVERLCIVMLRAYHSALKKKVSCQCSCRYCYHRLCMTGVDWNSRSRPCLDYCIFLAALCFFLVNSEELLTWMSWEGNSEALFFFLINGLVHVEPD